MAHKLIPIVETNTEHSVTGLTLSETVTKSRKFTLAQLRYACTADKLVINITREMAKSLIKEVARQNRYALFDSYAPYKIIFNGYGQLKSMELSDGTGKMNVEQIFAKLNDIFLDDSLQ